MMFGVGTSRCRLHAENFTNMLGEDEHGWGLSHKGLLWHNGVALHFTKRFTENVETRIGLLFDGIHGTLTYFKDGRCLGVAFRGFNEVILVDILWNVYFSNLHIVSRAPDSQAPLSNCNINGSKNGNGAG